MDDLLWVFLVIMGYVVDYKILIGNANCDFWDKLFN